MYAVIWLTCTCECMWLSDLVEMKDNKHAISPTLSLTTLLPSHTHTHTHTLLRYYPDQALFGLFQLGFIAIFLSEPLVSGYTTGAAVHVFTSQLRHIFGLEIRPPAGLFRVPKVRKSVHMNLFCFWGEIRLVNRGQ